MGNIVYTPYAWLYANPYDNQVGEIETIHRGLPYFEFHRSKEIIEFEEL